MPAFGPVGLGKRQRQQEIRVADSVDRYEDLFVENELRRHDADDRIRRPVEGDRLSNDTRIPAEPPFPELVRKDDRIWLSGSVVRRREHPSEHRFRPHEVEERGRELGRIDALGIAEPGHVEARANGDRSVVKGGALRPHVEVLTRRKPVLSHI